MNSIQTVIEQDDDDEEEAAERRTCTLRPPRGGLDCTRLATCFCTSDKRLRKEEQEEEGTRPIQVMPSGLC